MMDAGITINNVIYEVNEIAPIHYVYLGSSVDGQIDAVHEQIAVNECARFFQEFTVTRATGMLRGESEETLILHIATKHTEKVTEFSATLCNRFGQDGVGMILPTAQGGIYCRVVVQSE